MSTKVSQEPPNVSLQPADLRFLVPLVAHALSSEPVSPENIKNQLFFNDFEIVTSAAIYLFYSIWAPKGASRTIFGEAGDFFRHPCLPKGLFQSLLGAHGARRGPLRLDHH